MKMYKRLWTHLLNSFAHWIHLHQGVFNRFMDLSQIEQESSIPGSEEMYDKLIASNAQVIAGLTELFMLLETNHLHGFGDFIAGRIDAHNKHQWMLTSTLK
jgi:DNA-binding ferritin-like protein